MALNGGQYRPPALAAWYLRIGTEFEENEAFRHFYPQFCQASKTADDGAVLEVETRNELESYEGGRVH